MSLRKKAVVTLLAASLTVTGTALSAFSAPAAAKNSPVNSSADSLVADIAESAEMILASEIRKALNIPVALHDITSMQYHNLGNGEITLAYNLAHSSGRSVHEILDMRLNHKMGWGKIAKTLGVKLHGAVDTSVHILKESKLDRDAEHFRGFIKHDLDDDDDNDKNKGNKDNDNKNKHLDNNNSNNNAPKDNGDKHKHNNKKNR